MHFVLLGTYLPCKHYRICDNMYRGYFTTTPSQGIPSGEIKDDEHFHAMIGKVILTDSALEFVMRYEEARGLPDFKFNFRREGRIWVGERTGQGQEPRLTKCVLNQVELSFMAS